MAPTLLCFLLAAVVGTTASVRVQPFFFGRQATSPSSLEPVEARLSGPKLILHWGFPSEIHKVETEDGYIVSMFRIPWGRKGPAAGEQRPVVLMMHGLLQTADQWLLRGPDKDLALFLADLGFDVWMGNFRGSTYSKRHAYMPPKSRRYWEFSWHENGYYDLAAMMDYVRAVTSEESMFYIGHSMGTTSLLVLLSTRPEYNQYIRTAFMMAPIAYFNDIKGLLASARDSAGASLQKTPLVGEVLPRGSSIACRAAMPLCLTLNGVLAGYSPGEFNATVFRILLGHYPSGASYGQLLHYLQVITSGEFKQYDFGPKKNLARYGQPTPPLYNLENVVAPMYLLYAEGDPLSTVGDVIRLSKEIRGLAGLIKVPLKTFGHTDHLYAIHTYELEYKFIIDKMLER